MSVLDVPAEWWERALEGWRGWWAHHAGFARAVVRAQRVVSTVALVLGVIALVVVPRLAIGLVPALFMTGCLLVVGLLARTRTVGLRPLLLLMGISVPWSLLIAHATRAIGESIGLSTTDDGARIALAAFVEEPGKLLSLLLLAVVAPGRIRRLAAVDWALLGFATGAGFTIAEDGARRLAPPGMLAELLGENRLHYSLNPWTSGAFQLSGGSWAEQILGIDAAPAGPMTTGHQVPTMGVAMGVALGLALWRTAKPWWRAVAWLPPAAMLTMAIVDHACYNATVGWSGWADQDTAIPTWIRLAWQVRGQGHTQIAVSVALFITCMLVDARRRHRAGVSGDVALEAPKAPGLPMTGAPAALRVPVQAVVWLAAYTWSDLVVIAAAYGDRTLTRRARMAEGRAMGAQVRGVRQDAMTVTTPGHRTGRAQHLPPHLPRSRSGDGGGVLVVRHRPRPAHRLLAATGGLALLLRRPAGRARAVVGLPGPARSDPGHRPRRPLLDLGRSVGSHRTRGRRRGHLGPIPRARHRHLPPRPRHRHTLLRHQRHLGAGTARRT
ncbi:hypothetical protein [Actinomyces procaprae]|uniref:hypothetical protein n=1 Tax=Actinomyces procaprae TaxID=2560010 RepID=UPI0010A22F72|nr:hypothetical protein [Actinomyces procaprae]